MTNQVISAVQDYIYDCKDPSRYHSDLILKGEIENDAC